MSDQSTDAIYWTAKLIERLVIDGYVKAERSTELLDRTSNFRNGRGFLTTAELRKRSAPTPVTEPSLEDLLG